MSDQFPNTSREDEIDLGQLFSIFKKGLSQLFRTFLWLFVYVRSNFFILAGLGIIGLAAGFGLKQIMSEKLKTEVIVDPNLDSKHYLYDAVSELNGKIKSKDTVFFAGLDISYDQLKKFEITIEDLVSLSDEEKDANMKYLEVLQKFGNSQAANDWIRNFLSDQNSNDQRITFFYKDAESGPIIAKKLIDYLNNNSYFKELVKVYNENASDRIEQNTSIIEQLDVIIKNYTEGMNTSSQPEGQLILAEEDEMNIADLFALKNTLIVQTESKRVELQERKEPLSIINFGDTQPIKKKLFSKSLFLAPFVLIALFILKDIIRYLNRKSNELLN